jgi:hypothetical protein
VTLRKKSEAFGAMPMVLAQVSEAFGAIQTNAAMMSEFILIGADAAGRVLSVQ